MTKKVREKFFFVAITNTLTLFMILSLPVVFGENMISSWYKHKLIACIFWSQSKWEYILLSIVISIICTLALWKIKRTTSSIQAAAENHIDRAISYEKLLEMQHIQQKQLESDILQVINEYVYSILCSYTKEADLKILCEGIGKWGKIPNFTPTPIITDGRLSTLDLRHFVWNIGKRLGWSGEQCASFIKFSFPVEMKELEIETTRRTLRQKGSCIIEIDIPQKGCYQFNYSTNSKK